MLCPSEPPPSCHAVSFFLDDAHLCREVGTFIAEGLTRGEPAMVVTSPAHRRGIETVLHERGVDAAGAIAAGDLLLLDADATITTLLNGGTLPDADIYHRAVGDACRTLLRGRPGPVRIFGDMVDLLWERGQHDAAIRIEMLSNQLAVVHPISVICGYSMGHFLKGAAKMAVVRELHGRVHDSPAALSLLEPRKATGA